MKKLNIYSTSKTYSSISVDIFDTLLLRKIWPEDLQFLKAAESWVLVLRETLGLDTEPYELYTYRRDARRILRYSNKLKHSRASNTDDLLDQLDHEEVGIDEWFLFIIDMICDSYNLKISHRTKQILKNKMISIELEVEKDSLVLNKKLVRYLYDIKKIDSKIKIYFISDMYLGYKQINELLRYFCIDEIFDGGFCSSDLKKAKWSGKIFNHINSSHVKIGENLHIGDNKHSDVKMAKLFGNDAVFFNSLRNLLYREFCKNIGNIKLKKIMIKNRNAIRKSYMHNLSSKTHNHQVSKISKKLGYIFGAPFYAYVSEMSWVAKSSGILATSISSESLLIKEYIKKISPINYDYNNFYFAPKINRKNSLLVLADNILKSSVKKESLRTLTNIFRYGENLHQNRKIYQFIKGGSDYSSPDVVIDNLSGKEMGQVLSKLFDTYTSEEITVAKKEYKKLLTFLKNRDCIIIDVGWNGTTQALLQQSISTTSSKSILHGIYLGHRPNNHISHLLKGDSTGWLFKDISSKDYNIFVPEIWEYIYTQKNYGTGLQGLVKGGLDSSINYLTSKSIKASPMEIFYACRPLIVRVLNRPNKELVEIFGNIKFDSGFAQKSHISIVDTSLSRLKVIAYLIFKPRVLLRKVTNQYAWTAGYLEYYRIGLLLKPMLKIAEKITKNRLI